MRYDERIHCANDDEHTLCGMYLPCDRPNVYPLQAFASEFATHPERVCFNCVRFLRHHKLIPDASGS